MIVVTFGPVSTANIVGRAMYCLRTAVVHGPVRNRYKKAESLSRLLVKQFYLWFCLHS